MSESGAAAAAVAHDFRKASISRHGGLSGERIASALGIPHGVYTAWVSRLVVVRELDPQAVDLLLFLQSRLLFSRRRHSAILEFWPSACSQRRNN